MKSKKGYQPAIRGVSQLGSLVQDVTALTDLRGEMLTSVDELPERRVTRRELKRDLEFSSSGLRLLGKSGFLKPEQNGGSRETYSLRQALRALLFFPGFAQAPTARTVRKHSNITTVVKQVAQRLISTSGKLA